MSIASHSARIILKSINPGIAESSVTEPINFDKLLIETLPTSSVGVNLTISRAIAQSGGGILVTERSLFNLPKGANLGINQSSDFAIPL